MSYGMGQQAGVQQAAASQFAAQFGYAQEAPAPTRQLEVPMAVGRVESNLGGLGCALDTLDSRLTGYIARSVPPSKEAGSLGKPVMGSGLGQQLDSMADRIEQYIRRVNDLMDRLEA